MTEQKVQTTIFNETLQKEPNDINQSMSNGNVENKNVTVEVEDEKSGDEKDKTDSNSINNSTESTSLTNEIIEVEVSTKKIKKTSNEPKKIVEDNPYDPSKPVTDRINIAIKKYRKKHTFSFLSNQMFTSYLTFGGINTNQNQEPNNEDDVEVDFTYIVRVYLSGFLIDISGYVHMDNFREAPRVVISFLNFLLENKVFPEFEDDIREALRIAHKASDELPNCKALDQNTPGKFNKACSLLFGGELYGTLDDTLVDEELAASMIGISKEEGKLLIKKVFGANALKELKRVNEDSRCNVACEIIEVEPFQKERSKAFTNEDQSQTTTDDTSLLNVCESSNSTQVNYEANLKKIVLRECNVDNAKTFYVSECSDVVDHAMPGIFITADFHKLSNGFLYWDNVTNIYPSYYLMCDEDD